MCFSPYPFTVIRFTGRRRRVIAPGPFIIEHLVAATLVLAERHVAHQLLDVHASVAERTAGTVRLGDLGGEGDYALESGLDFGGRCHDVQE